MLIKNSVHCIMPVNSRYLESKLYTYLQGTSNFSVIDIFMYVEKRKFSPLKHNYNALIYCLKKSYNSHVYNLRFQVTTLHSIEVKCWINSYVKIFC